MDSHEEINTCTLINDLRSIIISEIGDTISKIIANKLSGKTFGEQDVLAIMSDILNEENVKHAEISTPIEHCHPDDHILEQNVTHATSSENASENASDTPSESASGTASESASESASETTPPIKKIPTKSKPKRKNKVSGYNVFKKDETIRAKINEIYLPRKEIDKSLKFSTVAAELWKDVDQTPYLQKAVEINSLNLPTTHASLYKDNTIIKTQ